MIKRILSVIICFIACILTTTVKVSAAENESSHSYTKAMGDSAYIKGDYSKAITIYEAILQSKEAPEIYYNLGNAYYKNDDLGKAILNYERAYLLDPSDDDINTNLNLARQKTTDRVIAKSEIFFVKWLKSLAVMFNMKVLVIIGIGGFILFLLSVYIYLFTKSILFKKISFFAGLVLLIVSIVFNLFGWYQYKSMTDRDYAIAIDKSINVNSTPSESGTLLFKIHEGHKVKVIDSSMKDWYEIQLEDGKVGWANKESLEII